MVDNFGMCLIFLRHLNIYKVHTFMAKKLNYENLAHTFKKKHV